MLVKHVHSYIAFSLFLSPNASATVTAPPSVFLFGPPCVVVADSELEEFETPARYRPDSLSALSRATRFTEDEIKRIYRGFKAECPTGVVKEDTFKVIYSQFFPQGGSCGTV